MNNDKWKEAEAEILRQVDIKAEAEALGVRFTKSEPNANGWLSCYAVGREEKDPSAAINVASDNGSLGRYTDKGTGTNLSFWDWTGERKGILWMESRAQYAEQTGVELPNYGYEIREKHGKDIRDFIAENGPDAFTRLMALADKAIEEAEKAKAEQPPTPAGPVGNYKIFPAGDKTERIPVPMATILESIRERTRNWPRRVGNSLFIHDNQGICWLPKTSSLFGWLCSAVGTVEWRRGDGFVSKDETFAELSRTSTCYQAIEELPHQPPIEGHYYAHGKIEPGDGSALNALIDRFAPETPLDRELILAAVMTLFWGGQGGTRPCFVITSKDGRGVGKSTLAEMLLEIAGGYIAVESQDDFGKIKSRILSTEAFTRRGVFLDNLKSRRFSWAELEGLITCSTISGWRMYVGEGTRPNTLTWFVTLNGANLSTDMAQRAVIIKLTKPQRSGDWEDETRTMIRDRREAIIADVVSLLKTPAKTIVKSSRWATWERDVLARLADPAACQKLIADRQGEADVEEEEGHELEDCFREKLDALGYLTDSQRVFIPSKIVTKWVCEAMNEKHGTTAVSRMVGQMIDEGRIATLRRNPSRANGRGFLWEGEESDQDSEPRYDILERLERYERKDTVF